MADLPKLTPYVIEEVLGNDSFYTHYRATATHLEEDISFHITEFNPSFMVRRTEDGILEPTERFIMEFETALERFTKMGEALAALNEPFIAPIEEILQLNNTVYIVRQMGNRYRTLDLGLGTNRMDFNEAYVMLRPLIQSLVAAWKKGLLFQFSQGDLAVTSYGQIILDSMFAWEGDHRHSIKELTKLYYRLITGVDYNPSFPDNPSIEALGFPPRLNATIRDILTGEPHYGSIDDFNKQLRTVMDAEGKREIIAGKHAVRSEEPKIVKKNTAMGLIAGLAAVIVLIIAVPIVWIFVLGPAQADAVDDIAVVDVAYGEAGAGAANGAGAAPGTAATPTTAFVRLHSGYAITDPQDPTIMLNGSFFQHGGAVYHRIYQNGYGLARRVGNSTNILASGVRPAFITTHGGYIYFSDGLSGYNIRRVREDGSGLETVSDHMATFLQVSGSNLFYTNHSNRDFLYRLDLNTMQSEPFLQVAAYEMAVHDGHLYFVNGSGNFRIYSVPIDTRGASPVRLNDANSDNLRISDGYIYYRDVEDSSINRVTLSGTPTTFSVGIEIASFDIANSMLAIIEAGTNMLWISDMRGEISSANQFASYVMISNRTAYMIDHNDSRNIRSLPLNILQAVEETYDTQ